MKGEVYDKRAVLYYTALRERDTESLYRERRVRATVTFVPLAVDALIVVVIIVFSALRLVRGSGVAGGDEGGRLPPETLSCHSSCPSPIFWVIKINTFYFVKILLQVQNVNNDKSVVFHLKIKIVHVAITRFIDLYYQLSKKYTPLSRKLLDRNGNTLLNVL